jgi:hypothetical protein
MKQISLKEAFRLLDDIGGQSAEELAALFSPKNVECLVLLSKVILGVEIDCEQISSLDFVQEILQIRKQKKILARKLGGSLILADEKYKKEGTESAIRILQDFIDKYPSPFYQEHALNQIEYYKKNNPNSK